VRTLAKTLSPLAVAALAIVLLPAAPANAQRASGTGSAGSAGNAGSAPAVPTPTLPMCTRELISNGGFEAPVVVGTAWALFDQGGASAWRTDDPAGKIELWGRGMNVPPVGGNQIAELNATGDHDSIYQDVKTKPGTRLTWSLTIRARNTTGAVDVDTTSVHFGGTPVSNQGGVNGVGGVFSYANSADDTQWKTLYGWYLVPSNQPRTRVTVTSVSHAGGAGYGNLVDNVSVLGTTC
jgi:hypothetical protein